MRGVSGYASAGFAFWGIFGITFLTYGKSGGATFRKRQKKRCFCFFEEDVCGERNGRGAPNSIPGLFLVNSETFLGDFCVFNWNAFGVSSSHRGGIFFLHPDPHFSHMSHTAFPPISEFDSFFCSHLRSTDRHRRESPRPLGAVCVLVCTAT